MGWLDRFDLLRWMEIADGIFGGDTRMVVHGISMGAATTMMASGEPQRPYVRCFARIAAIRASGTSSPRN